MMTGSILEAMYSGRISPWERHVAQTEERREIERRIADEKNAIRERLSPEDARRLDRLERLYSEASRYEDVDLFTHSFSLGAMLMQEVLERVEVILRDE